MAHIIHETLATKDVGEEARGILDVRSTLCADHLLPILVIHCPKVLSNRATAGHDTGSAQIRDTRERPTESESTRYASLFKARLI